jgi:hypothetical protein
MMRSFQRGVICSLWLPQSKVIACGNLECMPSSDDYRGGGMGSQSARKKNKLPRVCPWSLLVYWRRRRMCASTAAVLAFASHAAAAARRPLLPLPRPRARCSPHAPLAQARRAGTRFRDSGFKCGESVRQARLEGTQATVFA